MNAPRISIITPSFNQGQFINQTIDSVLGQNYPNLEYIVMDGGSTDGTLDILRSYGTALRWVSEKDNGQADAINRGMSMASGDILAFLNSDDTYLPGVLHLVAEQFSQRGCQWLTGDYRIVDQDSREMQGFVVSYKAFWRKFSSARVLSVLNYIIQPSTFWSRTLWEAAGPLDVSLRYTMDYDFWLRAIRLAPPLVIPRPLSAFRIHKTSKGGSQYEQQFDEEIQVLRRYNKSRTIDWVHRGHNALIKLAYRIIK